MSVCVIFCRIVLTFVTLEFIRCSLVCRRWKTHEMFWGKDGPGRGTFRDPTSHARSFLGNPININITSEHHLLTLRPRQKYKWWTLDKYSEVLHILCMPYLWEKWTAVNLKKLFYDLCSVTTSFMQHITDHIASIHSRRVSRQMVLSIEFCLMIHKHGRVSIAKTRIARKQ